MKLVPVTGALVALSLGFSAAVAGMASAETLQIGISNRSLLGLPILVAKEKGFFEAEGLDVSLDYFAGGAPASAALLGGSVQFIDAAFENNIKAVKENQPIVSIMNLQNDFAGAIVARKSQIEGRDLSTGAKVLEGLRIGTLSRGGFADVSTRYILRDAGLDPEKDAELVPIKGADRQLTAGEADQIDAAFVMEPWNVIALESGNWDYVLDLTSGQGPALFNGLSYTTLQTTTSYLEANPEVAEKTVRALVAALSYIGDPANIEAVAAVADAEYGAPGLEIMKKSLARQAHTFTPVLTEESVQKTGDLLVSAGVIEGDVPGFAQTVDARFAPLWDAFVAH